MISVAEIDALVNAGCTAQQLAAVVKASLQAEEERKAAKRYKDAIRKRNQRSRPRDIVGHGVTLRDTPLPPCPPSDKERSPVPPKEINSPLNPPTPLPPTAVAASPRHQLFGLGIEILKRLTGKPERSIRPLLAKWLKQSGDEAAHLMELINEADRELVADPVAWIAAHLRNPDRAFPAKPPTEFQSRMNQAKEISRALKTYATGSRNGGGSPAELFPTHHSRRPSSIHNGLDTNPFELLDGDRSGGHRSGQGRSIEGEVLEPVRSQAGSG